MLRGITQSYDFTIAVTKAYGNNMINVNISPVSFGIFIGHVNQDGFIDPEDLTIIFNDANNFLTGYVVTDVT